MSLPANGLVAKLYKKIKKKNKITRLCVAGDSRCSYYVLIFNGKFSLKFAGVKIFLREITVGLNKNYLIRGEFKK